jgi:predicted RND superfamily exporter protein
VLGGAGAYGFTQLDSEFALTDFVPQDEPLLETFEVLQAEFDGGFEETTQVLLTGPLATARAHDAHVRSLDDAGSLEDVETLEERADGTTLVTVLAQAVADEATGPRLAELGLQEDLTVAADADVEELYAVLLEEVPGAGRCSRPRQTGWPPAPSCGRPRGRTGPRSSSAACTRRSAR